EAARDRVAFADSRETWIERLFRHGTGRQGRQGAIKRRAGNRHFACIFRAGCDQQGAAILHILRDVIVIEEWQHIAVLVAVENDEVELVDLVDEEFTRREGDQRQFVNRRAVLLFRRAQNGEVDEIDGSIGFQQVAPGALAIVRLTGDEQHAQVLANAVHGCDSAIVGVRYFAGKRWRGDFDNVHARARQGDGDGGFLSDLRFFLADGLAIAADLNRCRAAEV